MLAVFRPSCLHSMLEFNSASCPQIAWEVPSKVSMLFHSHQDFNGLPADDDRGGTLNPGDVTNPVNEGEDSKMGDGSNSGDELDVGGEPAVAPKRKRKREFSKKEAIEASKRSKNSVIDACQEMMAVLLQRDIDPDDAEEYEEYARELRRNAASLRRLKEDDRQKKFRGENKKKLDAPFLKVEDHEMFATQQSKEKESSQETVGGGDSQDGDFDSLGFGSVDWLVSSPASQNIEALDLARPVEAKRRGRPPVPITDPKLCSFSRQKKVKELRKIVKEWSEREEVGCNVNQLLGLCLYLENARSKGGDRELASIGWKIFNDEPVSATHTADEVEALWIIERLRMSEADFTELRLRLLGRCAGPPNKISGGLHVCLYNPADVFKHVAA